MVLTRRIYKESGLSPIYISYAHCLSLLSTFVFLRFNGRPNAVLRFNYTLLARSNILWRSVSHMDLSFLYGYGYGTSCGQLHCTGAVQPFGVPHCYNNQSCVFQRGDTLQSFPGQRGVWMG
jgi:hypothetical protein